MLISLEVVKHTENPKKSYETYFFFQRVCFPFWLIKQNSQCFTSFKTCFCTFPLTGLHEEVMGQCLLFLTLICQKNFFVQRNGKLYPPLNNHLIISQETTSTSLCSVFTVVLSPNYCPRWDSFQLLLDFHRLDAQDTSKLGNLCSLLVLGRNRHFKDCSCDLIQLFAFG